LIAGTATEIQQTLSAAAGDLYEYGWPVVTLPGKDGRLTSEPVFTAACRLSRVGGSLYKIALVSEIGLNPNLYDSLPGLTGEGSVSPDYHDPDARNRALNQIARLWNVATPDLGGGLVASIPDRKGVHNAAVIYRLSDADAATNNLLQELRELEGRTDWVDTAAGQLLLKTTAAKTPRARVPVAPLLLNPYQLEVIKRSHTEAVTVVTGPPGTGKSQLVVCAAADAWSAGESVLLVSTNNAAVDVAVSRAGDVAAGLLVRTGSKEHRDCLPTVTANLVAQYSTPCTAQAEDYGGQVRASYEKCQGLLKSAAKLADAEHEMLGVVEAALRAAESFWSPEPVPDQHAADLDLVHAVAVVLRLPVFRRRRLRSLFREKGVPVPRTISIKSARRWVNAAKCYGEARAHVDSLRTEELSGGFRDAVGQAEGDYAEASKGLVRALVHDNMLRGRDRIKILGATSGAPKLYAQISDALDTLRGWGCTALSLRQNFSLRANLFGLVVVDEASQCPLAYVLPAAYRARRLLVVGDPNQLPPVVQLSADRSDRYAQDYGASHLTQENPGIRFSSETSAFEAFQNVHGANKTYLLAEHFRCHPKIARWFSKVFYKDGLQVLTDTSDAFNPAGPPSVGLGLVWEDVAGHAERGPGGESWVNDTEADRAAELVAGAVRSGVRVGVVTPYRAQANLIAQKVRAKVKDGEALAEVGFKSGTAHTFQGDERDLIVFSCCVADGIEPRSLLWVEANKNLINVAASRARQCLIVLGDPNTIRADNASTLYSLREYARQSTNHSGPLLQTDSVAEQCLLGAMQGAGWVPQAKTLLEGFEMDFSLVLGGRRINIEVDGEHHINESGRQRRSDVLRDRVLENHGYLILRYPAWKCRAEPHKVVEDIRRRAIP